MSGQVTIYTIKECPYSAQAKETLRRKNLAFFEVSVDEQSSELRQWLQKTTGAISFPQIFFNEVHVGGSDKLQAAIEDDLKWSELLIKLEEPFNISDLKFPSEKNAAAIDEKSQAMEDDFNSEMAEELFNSEIIQSIRPTWFSSKLDDAFSGERFVQWYCVTRSASEVEAINEGSTLIKKKFIFPVDQKANNQTFENDPKVFYRLNKFDNSTALNAGSTEFCDIKDALQYTKMFQLLIERLYDEFVSPDGKSVDYEGLQNSKPFLEYVKVSKELQRLHVEELDENERKAFFINLYNVMVIHGLTLDKAAHECGLARIRFYCASKYIVGGYTYSLTDIENGILRCNRKGGMNVFSPAFPRNDPRQSVSLTMMDPRIHFALNCGLKSCPPIKIYHTEQLDAELAVATRTFFEEPGILQIIPAGRCKSIEVFMPPIIKCSRSDFGETNYDLVRWVLRNAGKNKMVRELQAALDSSSFKLSFLPFDWQTNVKQQ